MAFREPGHKRQDWLNTTMVVGKSEAHQHCIRNGRLTFWFCSYILANLHRCSNRPPGTAIHFPSRHPAIDA
jgi:hypothetical protein